MKFLFNCDKEPTSKSFSMAFFVTANSLTDSRAISCDLMSDLHVDGCSSLMGPVFFN